MSFIHIFSLRQKKNTKKQSARLTWAERRLLKNKDSKRADSIVKVCGKEDSFVVDVRLMLYVHKSEN